MKVFDKNDMNALTAVTAVIMLLHSYHFCQNLQIAIHEISKRFKLIIMNIKYRNLTAIWVTWRENLFSGFSTTSDTNRAIQQHA